MISVVFGPVVMFKRMKLKCNNVSNKQIYFDFPLTRATQDPFDEFLPIISLYINFL